MIVLKKAGYNATSLQGNLTQQNRRKALDGFRDGVFNVLVATDIAARGIDVKKNFHVVNYNLPDTVETYTHRTGRTGRADQKGKAYTFVGQEDKKMISLIEKNLGNKIKLLTLPISNSNLEAGRHIIKRKNPAGQNGNRKCLWSKSLAVA